MAAIDFKDVYRVDVRDISSDVAEIEVSHIDWNDLQHEVESKHLLVTPEGVFFIADSGLHPVRDEDGLWCCIPKLIKLDLDDEDGDPYFSDNRAAREAVEHLLNHIIEVCPNWDTPIPGRRQSRRR